VTLKTARRRAKLTQRQLADQVGVDPSTISVIESGKRQNASYDTIIRICHAVGMLPDDLFPVTLRRRRSKSSAASTPVTSAEIPS
jgi:transcriptional regulator with XRE-family HTH domain